MDQTLRAIYMIRDVERFPSCSVRNEGDPESDSSNGGKDATNGRRAQSIRQVFQAIQALAEHALSEEEQITQSRVAQEHLNEHASRCFTRNPVAQPRITSSHVKVFPAEATCLAEEEAHADLEGCWRQKWSEDGEKAIRTAGRQQRLNARRDLVQPKLQDLEEARHLGQAAIRTGRNVLRNHSRNMPATSPQVHATQATLETDLATQMRPESGRATMYP
ncbi:hypothetical protein PF005_g25293 [Phytophthora fragariae]|uniref:Uncharacterized protein n=1 Tax=Phytophthora fragariae TaxID=53985 RepID=A0A6A3W423_9STRA|nr:hypothetical protein PF005_g25293 [Phytophthora fragariae]